MQCCIPKTKLAAAQNTIIIILIISMDGPYHHLLLLRLHLSALQQQVLEHFEHPQSLINLIAHSNFNNLQSKRDHLYSSQAIYSGSQETKHIENVESKESFVSIH
jgi:hypothetical protein